MSENKDKKTWLERFANWKVLLLLLAFYFVVFSLLMKGFEGGQVKTPPLDLLFSYSPDTVHHYLESLGEAGRKSRILVSATLDTAYPLVYSTLFAVLITLLARVSGLTGRIWKYLALLPFVILAFDLAENFSIILLSLRYPAPMPTLAHMASVFTSLKWICAYTVISITAVLGLWSLLRLALTQRRGA